MGTFFKRKETDKISKVKLDAPRIRKKKYNCLNKELFEAYKKENNSSINYSDFSNIIETFNTALYREAITNREGVDLPFMLGKFIIGACDKKKDKNYDWKTSTEIGKDVNHKNWESNQYLCKIFYTNYETKYKFPLMRHWFFKPCRNFQREVSSAFKKNWNFYFKVPPFQKIGKLKQEGIRSIKIIRNEKKGKRMDLSDSQPE
jgi:hypothetical protein